MNYPLAERIRRRLFHSLSPETSVAAGLGHDLGSLQQLAIGAVPLTAEQTAALARHFNIKETAA